VLLLLNHCLPSFGWRDFDVPVGDRIAFEETFHGVVGGNNYSYFAYTGEGKLRLILESLEGDADLYVAEKRLEASFDFDGHSLQSTSCGEDVVEVPSSFQRPIGIGVYGHPSYQSTRFTLKVIGETEEPEEPLDMGYSDRDSDRDSDHFSSPFEGFEGFEESHNSRESRASDRTKNGHKSKEKSFAWELILSLLEGIFRIIIEILT
jgi:hypothetical protein